MSEAHVVNAFLNLYLEDGLGEAPRTVEQYQALFPGHEALIAEIYERCGRKTDGDGVESRIGPFEIVREIGRGGQGVVYLAEDSRLKRRVALKVLTGLRAMTPHALDRLLREARIASRLDHPGICSVHEASVEAGVPYIAMQYVEGTTLAKRIASGKTRLSSGKGSESIQPLDRGAILDAVRIVEKAARALHAAHEAGIVHRDVKPGNILVTPAGEPVILDFGFARDDDPELATITRSGDCFGTPAYMSPEQIAHRALRIDRRTDVWSLGVCLYEALTFRRPFEAPTREGLYHAIQLQEPGKPRAINRTITRDLEVVMLTALEKERDRRYLTALAFAEDLRRAIEAEPILARRLSPLGRAWRWARRRPAAAALLAVIAVALPTIAALTAAHVANLPEIRVREQQKLRARMEEQLASGFVALHEGSPSTAEAAFTAALALMPGETEAIAGVAFARSAMGNHDGALAVLDDPRKTSPESPGLARVRRHVLRAANRLERSDSRPDPELRTASDFFLSGYTLVTELWDRPNGPRFAPALEALNRAVVLSPTARLTYHVQRARAAGRARAEATMQQSADDLITLWPDEALAWYGRAMSIPRWRADPSRVAALRRAIALRPCSPFWNNLGVALADAGETDAAIDAHQRALALDPTNISAKCNLAIEIVDQGHPAEGIATLKQLVDANPRFVSAWNDLGLAYAHEERFDDARKAFEKVLELEPEDDLALTNLGNLFREHGDFDEAVEMCRNATSVAPWNIKAWASLGLALRSRGVARNDVSDVDAAIDVFKKALERQPGEPHILSDLGYTFTTRGCHGEAIVTFEQLVASHPRDVSGLIGLAIASERSGRIPESVIAYSRALDVDPTNDQTRGKILALGRLPNTAEAVCRALEEKAAADPASSELPHALAGILLDSPRVRDSARALVFARTAVEKCGRKVPPQLRTLVAALERVDQRDEAVEVQAELVRLMDGRDYGSLEAAHEDDRLNRMRAAAASRPHPSASLPR